jgi:2-keto-4-pentenoate hydratase/2-oxohepta-3-ene-1,7-dioic acid hydratase in catechol pathway
MRFIGFLAPEGPSIGVVSDDEVRRLCAIDEFYADLSRWGAAAPDGPPAALADVTQLPPVPLTAKILCLGLNYQSHVEETGRTAPKAPDVFGRWYATLNVDGGSLSVPSGEPGLDWEGELAAVIGADLVDTPADVAMAGVLGYACFNDISARTYQRAGTQFTLGKNADGSGPIGPVVVTADELGDPYGRRLQTRVNGEVMQDSTTDRMIYKIDETIAYITRCLSLRPGDVVVTGTPEGVGSRMDPVRLMHAGDTCEVEIEGIGVLTTLVV